VPVAGVVWRFDDFELDTARYELRGGGTVIRVEPQVFDVMTQLVGNHERLVTKEELFDNVWGGRFVGEAALTSRIKAARRALGDDGESQRYIRTVRGRGYQFVGTLIEPVVAIAEPEVELPPLRQHIAFTRALDGVRLAYAVVGEGPPLVRAANWMTHLGYDIESPVWRHWVRDLSAEHTFIRYDERGCGLGGRSGISGRCPWAATFSAARGVAGRRRRGSVRGQASRAGVQTRVVWRLRAGPSRPGGQ
jgi:DNA-binding winged helix-turn-helix (wHTH) protein